MARIADVYSSNSNFLKSTSEGGMNLDGTPESAILTIKSIEDGKTADQKVQRVLSFNETDKKLGLNKTNAVAISKFHGDDDDDWVGKQIEVYAITDSSGMSDSGYCLRVRKPAKGAAAAPAKPVQNFTKATAWECWKKANEKLGDQKKSKEELGTLFKATLGKNETDMESDDWFALAEKAEEALSDMPF